MESTHHCRQPIFVTNPGSGRKALYVASQNSMRIEGMPRDQSEALLQRLFEIAEDPAIIYEHVWRVGDLIMWDNPDRGLIWPSLQPLKTGRFALLMWALLSALQEIRKRGSIHAGSG